MTQAGIDFTSLPHACDAVTDYLDKTSEEGLLAVCAACLSVLKDQDRQPTMVALYEFMSEMHCESGRGLICRDCEDAGQDYIFSQLRAGLVKDGYTVGELIYVTLPPAYGQ